MSILTTRIAATALFSCTLFCGCTRLVQSGSRPTDGASDPDDGRVSVADVDRPKSDGLSVATRCQPLTAVSVEEVVGINSPGIEFEPTPSPDGLTLYFTSDRSGTTEIYRATRSQLGQLFAAPTLVEELRPLSSKSRLLQITNDDALLASGPLTAPLSELGWIRLDRQQGRWDLATLQYIDEANSAANEYDPWLSPDRRLLVFTSERSGVSDIYWMRRDWPAMTRFTGPPQTFSELSSLEPQGNPSMSANLGAIVFSRNGALFVATRNSPAEPFASPQPIAGLGGSGADGEPFLSLDGCELHFNRRTSGARVDIFVARFAPTSAN